MHSPRLGRSSATLLPRGSGGASSGGKTAFPRAGRGGRCCRGGLATLFASHCLPLEQLVGDHVQDGALERIAQAKPLHKITVALVDTRSQHANAEIYSSQLPFPHKSSPSLESMLSHHFPKPYSWHPPTCSLCTTVAFSGLPWRRCATLPSCSQGCWSASLALGRFKGSLRGKTNERQQ